MLFTIIPQHGITSELQQENVSQRMECGNYQLSVLDDQITYQYKQGIEINPSIRRNHCHVFQRIFKETEMAPSQSHDASYQITVILIQSTHITKVYNLNTHLASCYLRLSTIANHTSSQRSKSRPHFQLLASNYKISV